MLKKINRNIKNRALGGKMNEKVGNNLYSQFDIEVGPKQSLEWPETELS